MFVPMCEGKYLCGYVYLLSIMKVSLFQTLLGNKLFQEYPAEGLFRPRGSIRL